MFFWDAVFWIKVIRDVAIRCFAEGICLVEAKEIWQIFWILVLDGKIEREADFFFSADAFEWFDSFWEDETIEDI